LTGRGSLPEPADASGKKPTRPDADLIIYRAPKSPPEHRAGGLQRAARLGADHPFVRGCLLDWQAGVFVVLVFIASMACCSARWCVLYDINWRCTRFGWNCRR